MQNWLVKKTVHGGARGGLQCSMVELDENIQGYWLLSRKESCVISENYFNKPQLSALYRTENSSL